MLEGKNILVGVTGGIAAYKVADVVSRLNKLNANVKVIMSEAATEFITPLTFQTLSHNQVHVDLFTEPKTWDVEHISLAQWSDMVLIAPATANTIGKVANGICDNMLTTVLMATKAKVVFAPAMNTNMYLNPIVQDNIEKLRRLGYEFISPCKGVLACGTYGTGKMEEPIEIVKYISDSFRDGDLKDKKIIITAGPTIEPLDPVRYMTNYSSGKMGYSLAIEARNRGAEVILISGPTNLEKPKDIKVIDINTTMEMLNAIEDEFEDCHVLIKSAAPLDYKPKIVSKSKIKKNSDTLKLEFEKNPDIAMHFGEKKGNKIMVGFAAETDNVINNATEKLKKKKFDFIVANDVSKKGAGFKTDTNIVSIIDKSGNINEYPLMSKAELSSVIIDKVIELLK